MKKIKIAIWGINVVLIAVILFLVLGNGFKNDNNKTDYKTYTVQRDNTNYFNGIVQETDKQAVSDQPKSEDETLTSTHVINGQKVTKGEVLFSFYRDMSSDLASANAEIQQAQLAIQAYNSTDQTTADKIELSKNQEVLAEAQAKINKINKAQSRTVLAPISGTYYKDDAGRSFIYGAPVIQGNVNEYSLDKIKLGANVTVIKNDGTKVSGNYEQKDVIPYSTRNVSYYHFRVATDDKLPYGMHVQIKTESDGYKIPSKAVWSKNTVYLLKNDKKHKKHVTMTKKDQDYYVIDGLKAGDKLVLK
ncbi:efflux RND transporter periplasmic adaptor subunit [Companilactobacillus zhachilii]|uniref:Efflux RND transporter periplasmic adaptor subunit n=1 Tax=Companilactobacillus zhachilii TaxID=2304606 RepID=A0A386PWG9_9LACO|nr:efflux RND transporter periplasmic adaptor subunit [Companilactobacillus zhachilii]AYE39355.1 efflux RND transporter periplasmic adaptor subunit [Companilactobacillus zhachilii]